MPDTDQPAEAVDRARSAEAAESAESAAPVAAPVADRVLLAAVDLARGALLEVTAPQTVGSMIGHAVDGERVLSLHFAADLPGYPGWHWSVTIARVDDAEPTVLETELLPGERALLAPEWVPWSERLAEYRAVQAAAAAAEEADGSAAGDDDDSGADASSGAADPDADDDAGDFDDDEDEDDDVGDAFDGIDIDALDEDADDDSASAGDDDSAADDSEADAGSR
ncbi:DUF3027 domain-containing protein [Agromyces marinus]|uniref:DUF3027 domain-containing protein n=1 Tax=Agromyces marinus TaxID=1389020 RepID=A0ABM8H4I2_9MICO|nr:DUF3027 domain-containing protein [Agromyces marinus]UIP59265.1 hypothetical protein DSM26151_21680 [Agromyces marinus]BDZ55718.1 hypothetical protein GCM10025870_27910 [Agromyces marinus]